MKELLQFISEGGSVTRYHTRPGIKPDTDAHHSHGVAMLCSILAGKYENGTTRASAYLLMAALTHDLSEQVTSDVNAPSKRLLGIRDLLHEAESRSLSEYGLDYEQHLAEDEALILQLADCFDCLLYCCRELALGNRNAMLVWRRSCAYAESILHDDSQVEIALRASNMYEAVKDIYHETIGPSGPSFDAFAVKAEKSTLLQFGSRPELDDPAYKGK